MKLKILYEDNHIIAVDKEAGVLSQGDKSAKPSLVDMVKKYIKDTRNKPGRAFCGPVHRLDKEVSGVMIFARTSKSARRLHAQFLKRNVIKIYIALIKPVRGKTGGWISLEHNITDNNGYTRTAPDGHSPSMKGTLRYRVIAENNGCALIMIHLLTGRKHQIRIQLSAAGYPVIGDVRYGSGRRADRNAICLHAWFISFTHPTRPEKINIFSSIPDLITDRFRITGAVEEQLRQVLNEEFSGIIN